MAFGAYATEIIRAGIEGIDPNQIEAGLSLGLTQVAEIVLRQYVTSPTPKS